MRYKKINKYHNLILKEIIMKMIMIINYIKLNLYITKNLLMFQNRSLLSKNSI